MQLVRPHSTGAAASSRRRLPASWAGANARTVRPHSGHGPQRPAAARPSPPPSPRRRPRRGSRVAGPAVRGGGGADAPDRAAAGPGGRAGGGPAGQLPLRVAEAGGGRARGHRVRCAPAAAGEGRRRRGRCRRAPKRPPGCLGQDPTPARVHSCTRGHARTHARHALALACHTALNALTHECARCACSPPANPTQHSRHTHPSSPPPSSPLPPRYPPQPPPQAVSQEALSAKVAALCSDPAVDGVIVQLPLPGHLDEEVGGRETGLALVYVGGMRLYAHTCVRVCVCVCSGVCVCA